MQKISRKTVSTSSYTSFDFDVNPKAVLIKNLTSGAIYVSLGEEPVSDDNAIKIPSMVGQYVVLGLRDEPTLSWNITYIKAASAGEVEVQAMYW